MIFLKKNLLPAVAISCLLPLSIQNAQASSSFSDSATFDVTITGLTNLTNSGNFSGLSYTWSSFADDYTEVIDSGDSTLTPNYDPTPISPPLSVGNIFSQIFSASGSANDTLGGTASAYYESSSILEFTNSSTTDTYKIDLTIDYILSSSANSDLAFDNDLAETDLSLEFNNANKTFVDGSETYATAFALTGEEDATDSLTLSIVLTAGKFDGIYALSTINGTLQSETSPVPVPAAIWFFGSALISLTGIRKLKATA